MNFIATELRGEIIELLFTVILGLLSTAIALAIPAFRNMLKQHTSQGQFDIIERLATQVVTAVEQAYQSEDGDKKKHAALTILAGLLDKQGIKVTADELDTAVEAAVMNTFNLPAHVEPAVPPNTAVVDMPSTNEPKEGDPA